MKSSAYWKKRFEQLENASHSYGQKTYTEIASAFTDAQQNIQKEIETWYQRFADNNEISLADARKMLSSKELAELKWDVNQYIKAGKENAVSQKWMKELENASARFHISRLEALKLQTQQALEVAFGNELDSVDKMARYLFTNGYNHTCFEVQKGLGVGWQIGAVDQKQLDKIVSKPWALDGKNFSERIWGNKQQMINQLHQELTRTLVQGKSPDEAIKKLSQFVEGKVKNAKSAAANLVQTEQAYFHTVAQQEAFNELDVEEYEIIATLDSHTSEICQEMDGQHFKVSEMEIGTNAPPFHPRCRTVTAPYFEDNFGGERAARGEDGKTYYVPDNMTYKDWKQSFVDGDTSGLKNVSLNNTINNPKDTIMNGLPTISSIKSNSDMEQFAEKLIDNLGIDRTNIDIKIQGISQHGYCSIASSTTKDTCQYSEYVLNANDVRDMPYKVKTAFHESYHLSNNGGQWDALDSKFTIKEAWRSLEETHTECAAHYMLERYGITDKLCPSYAKELVLNLPRLKQIGKYSSCNTIQDFGKIAFTDRQNGQGAMWMKLSGKMRKVTLPNDYYSQYYGYIQNHEDELFDMMFENMKGFEKYRFQMKNELSSAMNRNGKHLSSNEETVYYNILACAMQKVGIK